MYSIDSQDPYSGAMHLYRQQLQYPELEARIKRVLRASGSIEESILNQRRLEERMIHEMELERTNRYSQAASIEALQVSNSIRDLLSRQRENDLLSKISLDRTPLGNIHQMIENNRFLSPRYSAGLNGKIQSELTSRNWHHLSQTGNSSLIRQIQENNATREINDDTYIKLPSSPPMHPESQSKKKVTRFPNSMFESTEEDIYNHSDLSSHQLQRRLLCKATPKLQFKKDLEFDVASTLCNLSSIQPKMSEDSIETNSQGSFDSESLQATDGYPTRLSMLNDESELNSLHCFVRQELLELFYVHEDRGPNRPMTGSLEDEFDGECASENSDASNLRQNNSDVATKMMSPLTEKMRSDSSQQGKRVGFRCVHCAHLHPMLSRTSSQDDRYSTVIDPESSVQNPNSPMNVFYPKSLSELYRLVCKWQRVHFKKCRHIPPSVKRMYQHLKATDKTRGKTKYWVSSALELGLIDDNKPRGGIRYDPTKTKL